MGRDGIPAREISFVSLMGYGPNSDAALAMGVTASETRQGGSQHGLIAFFVWVERIKGI